MSNTEKRRELEEKILSKRQEIAFESDQADLTAATDQDNNENPDVMEDTKNFRDPASSAVDSSDMAALQKAKSELDSLVKELETLGKDQ